MRPGRADCAGRHPDARQAADASQRRQLPRELQHTTDQHTHRPGVDRLAAVTREHRRKSPAVADHRQIEQHRRGRRHRETAPGVEHARRERDQRHEADVGEHDAGHDDRAVELRQTRGHQPDDDRRGDDAQRAGCEQHPEQHRRHRVDQPMRHLVAFARPRFGEDRHEGLRERAFAEQPAQHVGNAKGRLKGIGPGAGAEHRRDQQFARQPGDARREREQGDRGSGPQQVHRVLGGPRRRLESGDYRKRPLTSSRLVCAGLRRAAILAVFAPP